jgi:hypothetical protein
MESIVCLHEPETWLWMRRRANNGERTVVKRVGCLEFVQGLADVADVCVVDKDKEVAFYDELFGTSNFFFRSTMKRDELLTLRDVDGYRWFVCLSNDPTCAVHEDVSQVFGRNGKSIAAPIINPYNVNTGYLFNLAKVIKDMVKRR